MKSMLPDKYREMAEEEIVSRITDIKTGLGPALLILTHHYQRQEIVDLGDFRGDSFALSKRAAEDSEARYIVFCGVHFMAESAAILARDDQAVFIPEMSAGCPMADMARSEDVRRAWQEMGEVIDVAEVTPVTYVNSSAAVKAFCGATGGATCTSSNADKIFSWARGQREKIFFMPDEHLGRNTSAKLGVGPVAPWDPGRKSGGLSAAEIKAARIIVWKGFCHVHTAFTVDHVKQRRADHPGCKVVVHPECRREVVEAADASGSTEGIIKYVNEQPDGAIIVVGTEIHLVERLVKIHQGRKTILPLFRSLCPNMYRINLHNLLWVLDGVAAGKDHWVNPVTVPADVKKNASLALRRMLEHGN